MISFVINTLKVVLRAVLPAFFRQKNNDVIVAESDPEFRKRLRQKISKTWMSAVLFSVFILLSGCSIPLQSNRTVYVPHGEAVRLRETLPEVKVWVMTPAGPVEGVLDLMEGWYCMSLEDTQPVVEMMPNNTEFLDNQETDNFRVTVSNTF